MKGISASPFVMRWYEKLFLLMPEIQQRTTCGSALLVSAEKTSYFHFDLLYSYSKQLCCLIVSGRRIRASCCYTEIYLLFVSPTECVKSKIFLVTRILKAKMCISQTDGNYFTVFAIVRFPLAPSDVMCTKVAINYCFIGSIVVISMQLCEKE